MPFRPPAALLYLSTLFRPSSLRPDIRIPSIAQLDVSGLRKRGFNAVIIDKDNCLTWPENDRIWPDLSNAWESLLRSFPPGRVLIVSNSAGLTHKDPGGIAAESTSLALGAPVLLHDRSKPACAEEILAYFRGSLGRPYSLRGKIRQDGQRLQDELEREESESGVWRRVVESVEKAPLLGAPRGASLIKEGKMLQASMGPDKEAMSSRSIGLGKVAGTDGREKDDLRILTVGDRQFTDVLLATRLSQLLPPRLDDQETVISIQTTLLPKHNDVRFLRWLEANLSRGRLRESLVDWGRYTFPVAYEPAAPQRNWRDAVPFYRRIEQAPRLGWDRSTWRPLPILLGVGRGVRWMLSMTGRGLRRGTSWVWTRGRRRFADARAARAAAAQAQAHEAAGGLQKVEKTSLSVPTAASVVSGAA